MNRKNGEPRTLNEAHAVLLRARPPHHASAHDLLAFHQRAAQLYQHISEIDPNHHHEALAFATVAREEAEAVRAEIKVSTLQARPEIDQLSGEARSG